MKFLINLKGKKKSLKPFFEKKKVDNHENIERKINKLLRDINGT